jgi:hypothetical protein
MVWRDWIDNVTRLFEEGNFKALHIMATINGLCLTDITHFLDYTMMLKESYGKGTLAVTLNILRFPSFQSPLVLPMEYRKEVIARLNSWYVKNCESTLLHDMEREHILRLIQYLENNNTPHTGASDIDALQKDFKRFYSQYDVRRDKDFGKTFPSLKDWYDGIST